MAIVHIHIERTGGVSIQNLYEREYPGPEMLWDSVRDGLFSPFNIKTANYTRGWHLKLYAFISTQFPAVRRLMLFIRTVRRRKHAVQPENLSVEAQVIIGHFSVQDVIDFLPPHEHDYRTIVREPLSRMWSHYCYWKKHRGDVGHRVSPPYRDDMTFEEFALLPCMLNYQSEALGNNPGLFRYIGTTDNIDEFAKAVGLIGEHEQVPVVNNFSGDMPTPDQEFIEKFKRAHAKDYLLYKMILDRSKGLKK